MRKGWERLSLDCLFQQYDLGQGTSLTLSFFL